MRTDSQKNQGDIAYEIIDPSAPFESGFSWKTIAAAIFVGLVMLPASMLISMTTGMGVGSAADWMVVILFIEITKRALIRLKTQEVLMIYWIAASLMAAGGAGGGPFGGWIWNQYLIQSPQAVGIRQWVPHWAIPNPDQFPDLYTTRTFFHSAWLWPFMVMLVATILGQVHNIASGYIMFRIFNDVEKLPFPMAKINAFGATALAESSAGKETWRWRMFSAGAMAGLIWGVLYIGIPVVGGLFWSPPPMLIKIPFWDFTTTLTNLGICAVPFVIALNVGVFMAGWVLPWRLVQGWMVGCLCLYIAFPILYQQGILVHWESGFGALATGMMNNIDFTISFQIGAGVLVAVVGIVSMLVSWRRQQNERRPAPRAEAVGRTGTDRGALPKNRGDMPLWFAWLLWAGSTLLMVYFAWWLINRNLVSGEIGVGLFVLIIFGFLFSPLIQYINGRLNAVMGAGEIQLPYMREACIYLSGAKGARVWFAPLPLWLSGGVVSTFKQMELTRTRFTSYYKMVFYSFIIVLIFSGLYWALLWKMGPIPSSVYPFIQRIWPFNAIQQIMWIKTTLPSEAGATSIFSVFLHPNIVIAGFLIGVGVLLLMRVFRIPLLFFYGLIMSLGWMSLFDGLLMFLGGLMGRYLIAPRLGAKKWGAYAPLIMAGFGAGLGLAGLFCVGFSLMWKAATGG